MSIITLTGDTSVRDILTKHPEAFPVFEPHGMCADCKAPPPAKPLQHFSSRHGVPLDQLITELAAAIQKTDA